MKRLSGILFLTFIFLVVKSQEVIQSYLPFSGTCPGEIVIPVNVSGFDSVASASMTILYDTNALEYTGYQNIHPALNTGIHVVNAVNGQILFSWFSLNPATIGDGLFMELKFISNASQSTALTWDTLQPGHCVFTDLNGNEIESVFHDGYIHNTMISPALLSPVNQATFLPTDVNFNWTSCECNALYEFQLSTDSTFSMVTNAQSGLINPNCTTQALSFNETYFWRVRAGNQTDTTNWSHFNRFRTKGPDAIPENLQSLSVRLINVLNLPDQGKISFTLESDFPFHLTVAVYDIQGSGNVFNDFGRLQSGISTLSIPTHRVTETSGILVLYIERDDRIGRIVKKISHRSHP
jgi:hypothetical protein